VEVINATGVVLHTNLGARRCPQAPPRAPHRRRPRTPTSNTTWIAVLAVTGTCTPNGCCARSRCRAALVVNNAAAAALLALSALARGREVIVSRGELVEIGGGFRVPEVLAQSGAVLREVGTTTARACADYAAAIGDRTAAILRVHPSNLPH
jgi:L-seryl-tRNA(Ser) seleniumtransferase